MKREPVFSPGASNWTPTRREFMGCSLCAAGMALATPSLLAGRGQDENVQLTKPRVRLVLAHPSAEGPIWPNIGYDFESRKKELLHNFRQSCPDIEFLPITVMSDADAQKVVQLDHEVDGYVFYLVGCLWGNAPELVAETGKPMVMVDDLFAGSGKFLTGFARIKRRGAKVLGVSSSRFEDAAAAANALAVVHKLQTSNALVVGRDPDPEIAKCYGTQIIGIPFEEINQVYAQVPIHKAKQQAMTWIRNAEKMLETTPTDVEKAAAMYLAMRTLLQQHRANAIAIHCLGGIYSKQMVEAYPCLGFAQLDDDGWIGACEADQRSMITKLIMRYLVDRPGFISDPVIDTAKNQIIYAHCVAPTKVFGPTGPSIPYHLRSHSEDRKGACNRSLLPLGEPVTTLLFDHNKRKVILHQGTSVENVDDDKACRTKLAVEVDGDVEKLMEQWDEWGWHRVTFYGNLKKPVSQIAALLGFEVFAEA